MSENEHIKQLEMANQALSQQVSDLQAKLRVADALYSKFATMANGLQLERDELAESLAMAQER